jgi:hypothetical protein
MKPRTAINFMLFGAAAALCAHVHAQVLDLTLTDANPSVIQGTTSVVFDATLSNPTASTIYLNNAAIITSSGLLSGDITPFLANAPLDLTPGASTTPFEIFDVQLASNTPTGVYGGNKFIVQGGADNGTFTAFDTLAQSAFSVTVAPQTVAAPELEAGQAASAVTFLLGAMALVLARIRSARADGR